ncbi:MAG: class I SAM-dependent methyltransferase [Planctomycetota bacterium]
MRYREFAFALQAIGRHASSPASVLDIGSPRLLPMAVARGAPFARVSATNILESEITALQAAAKRLGITNLVARLADARALQFPGGRFDLATSVSVFEHIAPEKGGDAAAARELGRVIAPGGVAVLTLPFAKRGFAEYRYRRVYERTQTGDHPIFFQRFYDEESLAENIVRPSGMKVAYLRFVEERFFCDNPRRRLAHYVNSSRIQNLLFGPFFPLLSRVFLSPPKDLGECKKPYIACLVLRKPR